VGRALRLRSRAVRNFCRFQGNPTCFVIS
jgi:hypothetical protein